MPLAEVQGGLHWVLSLSSLYFPLPLSPAIECWAWISDDILELIQQVSPSSFPRRRDTLRVKAYLTPGGAPIGIADSPPPQSHTSFFLFFFFPSIRIHGKRRQRESSLARS